MRLIGTILILSFVTAPTSASAQVSPPAPARSLIIPNLATAPTSAAQPSSAGAPRQPRDSLKNGAIVGALIGAVGFGLTGTWVCNMLQEPGDPSCLGGVLMFSAIGAGIGAGAGIGIDALVDRSPRGTAWQIRASKRW